MGTSVIDAAKEVVERARANDEVAMAMISQVRDQAIEGNKNAQASHRAIVEYIRSHPVQVADVFVHSHIGEDAKAALDIVKTRGPVIGLVALFVVSEDGADAMLTGATILANGPILTDERISAIGAIIEDDAERKLFYQAVAQARRAPPQACPSNLKPLMNAGRCVGVARDIQAVRQPGSSLTVFSPIIGWEHGE